jgi:hypothetical protein
MTLDQWKAQSPNNCADNTLIQCILPSGIYYRWNWKTAAPNEADFFIPKPQKNDQKN